jgi:hypothetical protein
MNDTIQCPHCKNEIEVTEVMSAQLAATIRGELDAEFAEKTSSVAAERDRLSKLQKQLDARQSDLDAQAKQAIEKERQSILAKARTEAAEAVAIEISDRDEQLRSAKDQLKQFEVQELELRQKARELTERAEQQELEVARRLDEERQKIRDAAMHQANEQNELKIAERDQMIEAMGKQVKELQRRLEQGSQQTQGEVQEIALQQLLSAEFPNDVIEEVAKGANGADLLHHVFDSIGRECGVILWESKRTKNWSDKWLSKAIDDQQVAKANLACIVTAAMPPSCEYFTDKSGVWVTSWACARNVAMALRCTLLEAAQVRRAVDGQQGKMELVYNYLAGPEFRNRVRGLVEPYMEMHKDLIAEKNAYNKHWNKRQKQLDRALASTTGLYGDLQGIIGSNLRDIEGMDLLAIEVGAGDENDSADITEV